MSPVATFGSTRRERISDQRYEPQTLRHAFRTRLPSPAQHPFRLTFGHTPATAPNPTTVAATVVRSPARPVRKMGDPCRQVSWLAARAPRSGLPEGAIAHRQWHFGEGSPLTVAGAATALDAKASAPRSLFTCPCHVAAPARTVTHHQRRRGGVGESIGWGEVPTSVPRTTQATARPP
jgi:hypothetical protein